MAGGPHGAALETVAAYSICTHEFGPFLSLSPRRELIGEACFFCFPLVRSLHTPAARRSVHVAVERRAEESV